MGINAVKARRRARPAIGIAALCAVAVLAGCALTQQAAVKQSDVSALVNLARLTPGGKGQADLRWVAPGAQWTAYKAVLINPVTFWADKDDAGVPAKDQQALCNYFHQAIYKQFSQKFRVADEPGPGVMRLQVAIVDAKAATPGLRSISVLEPHVRLLATLKYLATGTFPFVGGAQVEARFSDSESGAHLGEFVDRRLGGGSLKAGLQWEWGDAENAMNEWAGTAATRVASWTSGSATP